MKKIKLTKEAFIELAPCQGGIEYARALGFDFARIWNECERHDWLGWLVKKCNLPFDWAEYEKARDAAVAEYIMANGTSFSEYHKVSDSAIAEYEKAKADAIRSQFKECPFE